MRIIVNAVPRTAVGGGTEGSVIQFRQKHIKDTR